VKIGSTRVWLDYLDDETIRYHAKDVENYGRSQPYKEAYFGQSSVENVKVPQIETLLMDWNFEKVASSSPDDRLGILSDSFFYVDDISNSPEDSRYEVLGDLLGYQYTAKGDFFFPSDTEVVSRIYLFSAKQTLPEIITSSSTVNVLTQDDEFFPKDAEPFNYFWAIEKSMYQSISDEMIDAFASVVSFNNLIGEPVNRYRMEYKDLTKLRNLFYENIENEPNIEKYIEFYKWIDASMNDMLQQLIPASANFSEDMRNMIESHVLERNKYRNKYQYFGPRKDEDPTPLLGINEMLYNWKQGHASIREEENCLWWKVRARRDESPLSTGDSNVDEDRQQIHDVSTRVNSGSWESRSFAYGSDTKNMTEYQGQTFALRSLAQPYRFKVDDQPVMKSGTNVYRNKKKDYVKVETQPYSGTTIVVAPAAKSANSSCVDDDERNALKKEKVVFSAANQKYPNSSYENKAKGLILSPIDLYENITNDQTYWTNLHDDSYGEDKETPMQGPFTYAHVGGSPHRHVSINEADRPEAWEFDGTTFSEPADMRAKFYRDETAKRPLNIKNIKYDIDDAIYGNYRYDYEIVQTSGRRLNNVWLVRQQGIIPGSTGSTESDAVYGHFDFDLPDRGRNEHVFVERFSAPGSADTLARGMLDVESEEYSPYNALPFRNLDVRTKLNQWLTNHSGYGGIEECVFAFGFGAICFANFHKTQRNERQQVQPVDPACQDDACVTKYDNFWKVQTIPSSEYGYQWIDQSTEVVALEKTFQVENECERPWCKFGYLIDDEKMSNVSAYRPPFHTDPYSKDVFGNSLYGEYYTVRNVTEPSITDFLLLDNVPTDLEFEQGLTFVNNFQSFEGKNHPRTYDKVTAVNDITGEPITYKIFPGSGQWAGTFLVGDFLDREIEWSKYLKGKVTLNQLINNRQGPYGYSTWKQTRTVDNKVNKLLRKNNIHSIEIEPKVLEFTIENNDPTSLIDPNAKKSTGFQFKPNKSRLTENYIDPVVGWNKPMQHLMQFPDSLQGSRLYHTYSNNLEMFGNPFIDKRLALRNTNQQLYSTVLKQYTTSDNPFPITFYEMRYEEYIFPKHRNVTLKKTRQRLAYDESRGNDSNSINRRSNTIKTFWKDKPLERQRRNYDPNNNELTAKNPFGIQVRNSSVWALDYFKYIEPVTGNEQVMRGDLAWAGYAQWRGFVYEPKLASEILPPGGEEGNGEPNNRTWIAPRPTLQFIHNPNSQKAKEEGWSWNTELLTSEKPWYNSYQKFSIDTKLIGQNYSLVPEFRISEHMDFYINQRGGDFRAENKKMFEIVGNIEELKDSGEIQVTQEKYYSLDGVTEVEEYLFEPNCARGYETSLLGTVFGGNSCAIEALCPAEPPGDLDSSSPNWRCTESYPVADFNTSLCSFLLAGQTPISDSQHILYSLKDVDVVSFDLPSSSGDWQTYEYAWGLPVGFAPPEVDDTLHICSLSDPTSADLEQDLKIFNDRWENTFLVSFWVKLDSTTLIREYYDGAAYTKNVGGFHLNGGIDYIQPGTILSKTKDELKQVYSLSNDQELAAFINTRFDPVLDPTVALNYSDPPTAYEFYNNYRAYQFLKQFADNNPNNQAAQTAKAVFYSKYITHSSLKTKQIPFSSNFYIADIESGGRATWVDNIGNKIEFNVRFGEAGYEWDSWHHISLLYVGGTEGNTGTLGYNPTFHRVFLWVNNQRITSQFYNESIIEQAVLNLEPGVVAVQKENGTLFMANNITNSQQIRSFGTAPDSFMFARCEESSVPDYPGDYNPTYTMPAADLPGRVTDLTLVQGGEVGIRFVPDATFISAGSPGGSVDSAGPCEDNGTKSSDFAWFFDNTVIAARTNSMKSTLVKSLYDNQCADLNEVFRIWTTENFDGVISSGGGNPFDLSLEITEERNIPVLVGWWKLGISQFDRQFFEEATWTEDFFRCYSHTDNIRHLPKVLKDHKGLPEIGQRENKVLRLEVDTVKKLLPYNGFYPSQRAVQLGSLFYDSLAPFVSGANDNVRNERYRTEQALLQPFFAPGILFNTIKSGIAVDWAAYVGNYDASCIISMRDEFLGEFSILDGSDETEGNQSDTACSNSPGGNKALMNTQLGKSIIKKAVSAMSRDVLLGRFTSSSYKEAFGTYYQQALNSELKIYQSLAKKLERINSARAFEEWAYTRSLDPNSKEVQEQYRATRVRDPDWSYLPKYAKKFSNQLKSLADKTANNKASEIEQINEMIQNSIEQIQLFPPASDILIQFGDNNFEAGIPFIKGSKSQPPGSKGPTFSSGDTGGFVPPFDLVGGEIGDGEIGINPDKEGVPFTPADEELPPGEVFQDPDVSDPEDPSEEEQEEEALQELLNRLEGTYLESVSNFRIPFEGLIRPGDVLPIANSAEASKIFFLAPSFYTEAGVQASLVGETNTRFPYFEWSGQKNVLYELAMNNFLAEVPNFFLKTGKFTTFASKPEKDFNVVFAGQKYCMDVHLYKTTDFLMTSSPYDGVTAFVDRFGDQEQTEPGSTTLVDAQGEPYTTQGRYYGPAVRYKTKDANTEEVFYIGDPAQAPYTPPYFYGRAKARITYVPNFDGKPTLSDIFNNAEVEYINEEMDSLFEAKALPTVSSELGLFTETYKDVPAYVGRMPIQSSINLFGITKQRNVTYDVVEKGFTQSGFVANTAEDTVEGADVWTISPRFECPTLNFNTIENKSTRVYEVPLATSPESLSGEALSGKGFQGSLEKGDLPDLTQYDRNIYGAVSRDPRGVGMWSGYGFIPEQDQGIFMTVEDSYKKKKDSETSLVCNIRRAPSVFLAIDSLNKLDGTTVRLTDIFGNSDSFSIGAVDLQLQDIDFQEPTQDNDYIELLANVGLPTSPGDAPLYGWEGANAPNNYSPKVRTRHTAEFGDLYESPYNIEFGYDGLVPKAAIHDVANAICYHINYLYNTKTNWNWKADVAWTNVQSAGGQPLGLAALANFEKYDEEFSEATVSAVLRIDWAPRSLKDPLYSSEKIIKEFPEVQITRVTENNSLNSPPGASIFIVDEKLQVKKENFEINPVGSSQSIQAPASFYENPDGDTAATYEFCSEVKSLIDLCGFQSSRSRIGDIADEKEISEAVVMIPFSDSPITGVNRANTVEVMGRNFFKISKKLYNFTKSNIESGVPAIPKESELYKVENSVDRTTVSNMITAMKKYNIPPQLDFITYPPKESEFPFVMYIFEFSEVLSKVDLSNIWQGLMPQAATVAKKETQVIEHEMNKINFFEGKELPENIRWMVFRVKRRANVNYFQVTSDSRDDDRFKFDFEFGNESPNYSYNWPYDFCSLVEMARVKGGVSILPPSDKKEPISDSKLLESVEDSQQEGPGKNFDNNFDGIIDGSLIVGKKKDTGPGPSGE
jgi:hypothetical protein